MKIITFVFLCLAALCVPTVTAFDWQKYLFALATPKLIPTYKLIDQTLMWLLIPISKKIFTALSPLVCAQVIPMMLEMLELDDEMTEDDKVSLCNEGVDMWAANYFI